MPLSEPGFQPLALRERAYTFLAGREPVAEDTLLAHVYGGALPAALHAQLAEPLLSDPRLERRADGCWAILGPRPQSRGQTLRNLAFTALVIVASGPNPDRSRVVQVSALHMQNGSVVERFSSIVNPRTRVPRYVADRIGLAPELLDSLQPFASTLDDLVRFLKLDARPIVAQDARLTWAFVEAEARRHGQVLAELVLIDANELASQLLDLRLKPTLGLVAAHLGIGMHRLPRPDEEARALGLVAARLLSIAAKQGLHESDAVVQARPSSGRPALRRSETIQALSDAPGVYMLRDLDQQPVYVGKARRLRSRMAAYVNRPLGATRRLEGLVSAVQSVDSVVCSTDLEALILEDREIRRLQPRFNTVRRQRTPRLWIRRRPRPEVRPGKRRLAPPRLELSLGPMHEGGHAEFVGPFRNESLAAQARLLARRIFALDTLRREDPVEYADRLDLAWLFLTGDTDTAVTHARHGPAALLRMLLDFDLPGALLPADPRIARYAVLRPTPTGIEGCLIERGVCMSWVPPQDGRQLGARLLADAVPRTTAEDVDVVLHWFGAQRPPAVLVHLPDDFAAAAEAIEDAALQLRSGLSQT